MSIEEEELERIFGKRKIARLLLYSPRRDDFAEDENIIEDVLDQQPFVHRWSGLGSSHLLGERVIAHMEYLAKVGNELSKMSGLLPLFGSDVINYDEPTKRACFECDNIYEGLIECPACGSASGEPFANPDGSNPAREQEE